MADACFVGTDSGTGADAVAVAVAVVVAAVVGKDGSARCLRASQTS